MSRLIDITPFLDSGHAFISVDALRDAPEVESRPTADWFLICETDNGSKLEPGTYETLRCKWCGYKTHFDSGTLCTSTNFCANCGAEMTNARPTKWARPEDFYEQTD